MSTPPAVQTSNNKGELIILNKMEKDDIQEALPVEWTKPEHLGEATIYNMAVSPPCCKIRTIFSWYKVCDSNNARTVNIPFGAFVFDTR